MRHLPPQPEVSHIMRRHATAVSVRGEGVLLLGESGVGKSDLALRLIEAGGILIADDQVDLHVRGEAIMASPPPSLAGVLELYGIGLVHVPYVPEASIRLVIRCERAMPERLPPRRKWIMEGIALDEITLDPLHPSTPAKLQLLLAAMQSGNWLPEDWLAEAHQAAGFGVLV